MARRASRIFPPNALPRMTSCTRGKIMDASMSAGERKNLRISRSTMAIIRFMSSIPGGSWLQPRPLRHHEGICLLQFVAQLPARVVHEYIVQRRVLHREPLHCNSSFNGHFYQFSCCSRAVTRQHSVHACSFVLHGSDFVERVQALLPIF